MQNTAETNVLAQRADREGTGAAWRTARPPTWRTLETDSVFAETKDGESHTMEKYAIWSAAETTLPALSTCEAARSRDSARHPPRVSEPSLGPHAAPRTAAGLTAAGLTAAGLTAAYIAASAGNHATRNLCRAPRKPTRTWPVMHCRSTPRHRQPAQATCAVCGGGEAARFPGRPPCSSWHPCTCT